MRPTHRPLEPGEKIHRFTVIRLSHTDARWRRHYLCRCVCGTEKTVQRSLLTSGNTKSCGCWSKEQARKQALPHGTAARNQAFSNYRYKAKKAGIDFAITKDQFGRIAALPCFYCGAPPSNIWRSPYGTGDFVYSGLDKIDARKTYTINNVVPCCHACNYAKSDRSQGEFISWIKRTHAHLSAAGIIA